MFANDLVLDLQCERILAATERGETIMTSDKPKKTDFYDRVLSGIEKVDAVFESNSILAFHHTKPSYPFHIVIIPKKKILDFMDPKIFEDSLISDVFRVAQEILKNENFDSAGFRIVTNAGSYQESGHLHFHLISGSFKSYDSI